MVISGPKLLITYDSIPVLANTAVEYDISVLGISYTTNNTTTIIELGDIPGEVDVHSPVNVSVRGHNDAGVGEPSYCTFWYPQGEG